jgi:hypothetical protein
MYIFIFYIRVQIFVKTDMLRGLCKKDKKKSFTKMIILALIFIFLIEKSVFLKRLCERVEYEVLRAKFSLEFYVFKYFKNTSIYLLYTKSTIRGV